MPTNPMVLVDTNVVLYAHDPTDPFKHNVARALLRRLWGEGSLAYSAQVLNEFYSRAVRPGKPPSLSHEEAAEAVREMAASCEILPITASVVVHALDAVGRYQLSFWDALIWAVARENSIQIIYTEDVPGQQEIEGVRYVNPFM